LIGSLAYIHCTMRAYNTQNTYRILPRFLLPGIFFITLIAFMEYKVFESVYSMTGDIVLSVSVLGVTAFGGVLAETILNRNTKATDDQRLASDWLFNISLAASALSGFGIWAQASGMAEVNFWIVRVALPDFAQFVFGMITIVTITDILLLRWYIREDVDMKHSRNYTANGAT